MANSSSPEGMTNIFKEPAETTAERMAVCDMLDMWVAIAEGHMGVVDTAEHALAISALRGVPVVKIQSYMRETKEVARHFAEVASS